LQNEFFGASRFGGDRALIRSNGQANRTFAPAIAQGESPVGQLATLGFCRVSRPTKSGAAAE
jgi:hypothetical protein